MEDQKSGDSDREESFLAVSVVRVHGTDIISRLVKAISLKTERTNKVFTVANGNKSGVVKKCVADTCEI